MRVSVFRLISTVAGRGRHLNRQEQQEYIECNYSSSRLSGVWVKRIFRAASCQLFRDILGLYRYYYDALLIFGFTAWSVFLFMSAHSNVCLI